MVNQVGTALGLPVGLERLAWLLGFLLFLIIFLIHNEYHHLSGCEVEQACNVLALWGAQVTLLPESTFQLVGLRLQHTV